MNMGIFDHTDPEKLYNEIVTAKAQLNGGKVGVVDYRMQADGIHLLLTGERVHDTDIDARGICELICEYNENRFEDE